MIICELFLCTEKHDDIDFYLIRGAKLCFVLVQVIKSLKSPAENDKFETERQIQLS